jgi:hypothetical protein
MGKQVWADGLAAVRATTHMTVACPRRSHGPRRMKFSFMVCSTCPRSPSRCASSSSSSLCWPSPRIAAHRRFRPARPAHSTPRVRLPRGRAPGQQASPRDVRRRACRRCRRCRRATAWPCVGGGPAARRGLPRRAGGCEGGGGGGDTRCARFLAVQPRLRPPQVLRRPKPTRRPSTSGGGQGRGRRRATVLAAAAEAAARAARRRNGEAARRKRHGQGEGGCECCCSWATPGETERLWKGLGFIIINMGMPVVGRG